MPSRIAVTDAETTTFIPRRDSAVRRRLAISLSKLGRISLQYSTMVTLTPNEESIEASSTPITPPPITQMLSGSCSSDNTSSLVIASSAPGIGSIAGLEPVAITMRGAV